MQAISRILGLLLLACVLLTPAASPSRSVAGARATKENLELSHEAIPGAEEEDAPEIISFYGQQLEGDAFFFVVDSSASMRDSGELGKVKQELTKTITELTDRLKFGVVFFNRAVKKFPSSGQPVEANPDMKSAAISFVQSEQGSMGSCCQQGIVECLKMASEAPGTTRKVMVYVGDGGGTCGGDESQLFRQTLAAITSRNHQRVAIHCIGVMQYPKLNEQFMRSLANANQGTYTRMDPTSALAHARRQCPPVLPAEQRRD